MTFFIVLTSLLIVLLLAITVGNAMVLVLYCYDRCLRMAANVFICMMCITDLLVGASMTVCIALLLKPSLQQNTVMCMFLYAFTNLFMALSLHFQAAIAWDRWLAISHPFHYANIATMKWVLSISGLIWVFCIGVFLVLPVLWKNDPDFCHFWLVLKEEFLLYVAAPIYGVMTIIVVYCYGRIFYTARKLTHPRPSRVAPECQGHRPAIRQRPSQADNDMKAAKTLAVVVCLNVITWLPCLIILIILAVDDSDEPSEALLNAATVTIFLPCLHSAWNPWVYALRLPAFRAAFKRFRRRYFGTVTHPTDNVHSVVTISHGP